MTKLNHIFRLGYLCSFTTKIGKMSSSFLSEYFCFYKSVSIALMSHPVFARQAGVTGFLPAVYVRRTDELDAWTIHRSVSLANNGTPDSKSESDSATESESNMASKELAAEKSAEIFKQWDGFWTDVANEKITDVLATTGGEDTQINEVKTSVNGERAENSEAEAGRRWIFAMRHGERVDLTYGPWVPHCFDENGRYIRKDLNMPLTVPERQGGAKAFARDGPLTRVGILQAELVGEGLRAAGVSVSHVVVSAALRCVQTAQAFLQGLQADPSIKIKVEPGLFEYKMWHSGLPPFMTIEELVKAGFNVDTSYKPYVELDSSTPETWDEFLDRNERVMHSVYKDTESEGGNIIFIGHASTLDTMWQAMRKYGVTDAKFPPYNIFDNLIRIPYCALAAVKDKPWQLVPPPCPPSINSGSGRMNWQILGNCDRKKDDKIQ